MQINFPLVAIIFFSSTSTSFGVVREGGSPPTPCPKYMAPNSSSYEQITTETTIVDFYCVSTRSHKFQSQIYHSVQSKDPGCLLFHHHHFVLSKSLVLHINLCILLKSNLFSSSPLRSHVVGVAMTTGRSRSSSSTRNISSQGINQQSLRLSVGPLDHTRHSQSADR